MPRALHAPAPGAQDLALSSYHLRCCVCVCLKHTHGDAPAPAPGAAGAGGGASPPAPAGLGALAPAGAATAALPAALAWGFTQARALVRQLRRGQGSFCGARAPPHRANAVARRARQGRLSHGTSCLPVIGGSVSRVACRSLS